MMLNSIFKTTAPDTSNAVDNSVVSGGLERHSEESYAVWGGRYAGAVQGSIQALKPALDQVILTNKTEQIGNEEEQERRRHSIQAEIDTKNNDIEALENKKKQKDDDIQRINACIEEKKNEIVNIREGNNHRGIAKTYFYIGLFITVALAVYLFVFYSSAAFSALYRSDFENAGDATFYPHAFQEAWNMSLGNFLLILLLPVIFLGLGFLLHHFSQEKSNIKYAKIFLIYFITFCFDALLAFGISEKTYTPTYEMPQYTMKMAFNSPDFWIVIFLGFIAYLIWGLVFDFTMDSYKEMTEGSSTIQRLQKEITNNNNKLGAINQEISNINAEITDIRNKIAHLKHSMEASSWYDITIIKNCLNEFFSGWLGYMTLVGKSDEECSRAKDELERRLASLTQSTITYNEK